MNIERDRWLYVYTHSAQRAREFFGLPPDAEVRLSEEQIEGALPCWAVKVPKGPHWSDKGKIRLECRFCNTQHDMSGSSFHPIAAIPPGWTDVKEVRSYGRAITPVPDGQEVNYFGDTNSDWQTHFGVCPECREECKQEAVAPEAKAAIQEPEELLTKEDWKACLEFVNLSSYELSNKSLAATAKGLLIDNGGFTLDEYGDPATGNLWAVSVPGKEQKFPGRPSVDEIKAYLDRYPLGAAHFGGWYDKAENVTYLDHTELYAHKHTAVLQGQKYNQKAIYNLKTEETIEL